MKTLLFWLRINTKKALSKEETKIFLFIISMMGLFVAFIFALKFIFE